MKTRLHYLFLMLALPAALMFQTVTAQTFTTLYNFTGGSDGNRPSSGLILSGNTLFGTTLWGGSPANGAIFAISTNGTGFTNLHSFAGSPGDGANPMGLILSG